MKNYIEFKLHAGRIPFFILDFLSISPINGKYYGITMDSYECYVPDTLITLTEAEFKTVLVTNAKLNKLIDDEVIPLTTEEKAIYIDNWLEQHPIA